MNQSIINMFLNKDNPTIYFMKKMTCKQLGGACDKVFEANTFEEIAELSKKHGIEMFEMEDVAHLKAMAKMQELMENPERIKRWFEVKRKEFEAL